MLIWYVGGVKAQSKPNLVRVAAPGGAGRSTVADFFITNRTVCSYFNAHVLGSGMAAGDRSASDISAGRAPLTAITVSASRN